MRSLNKVLAVIFSILIVFFSISLILFIGDVIKEENITNILDMLIATREAKLTTIIVSAVVGLLAVIFGISVDTSEGSSGGSLTLPLKTGNVSISAQTFETMVLNVTKKYNSLKNVKAKVDIREDGLYIDMLVYVLEGTVVADVMCKIQEDVKSTVLKQTTVEVKMVEIKVKGIYSQTENKFQD